EYAVIESTFQVGETLELRLDLTPRFVGTHHRLDASRGAVALERGPLVYAIENQDQDPGGAASVDHAAVDPGGAASVDHAAVDPGGAASVDDAAVDPGGAASVDD